MSKANKEFRNKEFWVFQLVFFMTVKQVQVTSELSLPQDNQIIQL